jgi:hypothetical protein
MIAPPQYKCEVVTLDKNGGSAKIIQAVAIIEKEIKLRGGKFELVCGPTRIGTKGDGIDTEDIIAGLDRKEGESSSGEESNEEGMGDIDLMDDGIQAEDDDDEEE